MQRRKTDYHRSGEVEVKQNCTMGVCARFAGYANCVRCGFNVLEAERRHKLPLIEGEDGLCRKYVGTRTES